MNIVTSICVDIDEADSAVVYPATLGANSKQRKNIYWRCVAVFFATSIRCNPEAKQVLYTNDRGVVSVDGVDIKKFLKGLNVEIRYKNFADFKPPTGLSHAFKNAFYKLDVIKDLASDKATHHILLDSDCVWAKKNQAFMNLIKSGSMLLYDIYKSYEKKENRFRQTRINLGKLYKVIDPDYPKAEPTQFGGEIVAGSSVNFKVIADLLDEVYPVILERCRTYPMRVDAERSIFDGDEFLTSYVYNNMPLEYVECTPYVGRIWNSLKYSNASKANFNLTIWHMPSEKTQGFPLLFKKITNKNSLFWNLPPDQINTYLGKYLGVPKQFTRERSLMLVNKILQSVKRNYFSKT
jgi:hypothetical protein